MYGHIISGDLNDLACAQLLDCLVVELGCRKGLESGTVALVTLSDGEREPADFVSCGDDVAVLLKDKDSDSAHNLALRVTDALGEALLLVDESRYELGGVDRSTRHRIELSVAVLEIFLDQRLSVVHHAYCGDGIPAES